jgi:uncharacterized protein YprB with RNaseH-like and TPR domain
MSQAESRDLRRRLKRLGRGSHAAAPPQGAKLTTVVGPRAAGGLKGREIATPAGSAFCIENRYPIAQPHGPGQLRALLEYPGDLAAQVAQDQQLSQFRLGDLAFLDTETTGLAGGAGTLVFLVGLGHFEDEEFVLRQYFLRDPAEEAGMLTALREHLDSAAGFVTFNGRAFDLPLLETRYLLGLRQALPISARPHLDLLHPSRRLWNRQLPDCRLGTIEQRVLGVARTEADVPGAEIPGLYLDYLRTGDTTQMQRVVYHNAVDILSLVGLATEVLRRYSTDEAARLTPSEALAVARWHERAGRPKRAEAAYRSATGGADELVRIDALRHWTAHLKRAGRQEEAAESWKQWHASAPDDPRPCIELAKLAEWTQHDLAEARRWSEAALVCLSHWTPGWRRDEAWAAIEHRLARLARKQQAS